MPHYDAAAFFIVAHMDDWQLFMNPQATWEMSSDTVKVIFIYTTGNDAGGDENYWRANEEAAVRSIEFSKLHTDYTGGERGTVRINLRNIHRWSGGNTVCYFLRLPDGNVAGEGFISQGYQSLRKLRSKDISFIKALDQSSFYYGWQDFICTLQQIIDLETKGIKEVRINYPETDPTLNPNDHSDHILTGQAVEALPKYKQYRPFSYIGYDLIHYPADLKNDDLFWKVGQFTVYDQTLYELSKYSILKRASSTFISFCLRSARFREIYDFKDRNGL
ncbi:MULTISPECIES: PIG-L family deacetylase [unclassified Paenibacillus]|uniref:PIG-L family deacetylase n=1 Tax=unclassified Paenibacillus TaxID=185978 RepID=UPI00020D7DFA|nr:MULTISPECIES: PIG-L family deacetylase [unclassified Paenibacillus]EGL15477.1 hypothetical protein HMPREF9413_3894 [Paenibacillus sp. HGF7]EPD82918.1 hypothetical protein HMPREF1207_03710 [Paenibacillus sp. HGH0039]